VKIPIDIDIEKFRYSLVGDGYTLAEVKAMTTAELINILTMRIKKHIESEYTKSERLGLLEERPRDTWETDWSLGSDISANMNARWSFFRGE
jgi:hypothetical protein